MQLYPEVGIGILNWNGKAYLEKFLPFLKDISYPNYTIYVIDNTSTDDSIEYLRVNHPDVRIIETGGNFGVAGGYNVGFKQMQEKYLLMLNSDIEVKPGFLEPLVELMEKDESVAMCQSVLLSYAERGQFEYGGAAGGFLDRFGYSFCRGRIFDTVEEDNGQYPTAEIFWAGGACGLIRREAYWKVKGMFGYYFMHFEEVDLCWRFHRAGYKVYCHTGSKVFHVGGGTLSYQSSRKTFYNFRNNLVMLWRNSSPGNRFISFPVRMVLDSGAGALFLAKGDFANFIAVFKGYFAFLRYLFFVKDPGNPGLPKPSLLSFKTVYSGSIVVAYFLNGLKKFSMLNFRQ